MPTIDSLTATVPAVGAVPTDAIPIDATVKDAVSATLSVVNAAGVVVTKTVPIAQKPPPTYAVGLFGTGITGLIAGDDPMPVSLGMRFNADLNGAVTGVRFFKTAKNTGQHTIMLYDQAGALLASKVVAGETASGWQTQLLDAPVPITAGQVYTVAYHAPVGNYSHVVSQFAANIDAPPLHTVVSAGCYAYSPSPVRPNLSYQNMGYGVDVIFMPGAVVPPVIPPVVPPVVVPPVVVVPPPTTVLPYLPFFMDANNGPRRVAGDLRYVDRDGVQKSIALKKAPASGQGWERRGQWNTVTIYADGAVVDGYDFAGEQIIINQGIKGWHISKCDFSEFIGANSYIIRPGGGGVPFGQGTIEDCLFRGRDFAHPAGCGVWLIDTCGPVFTYRCRFQWMEMGFGFNGGGTAGLIQDSYFHDMGDSGVGGHFEQINITGKIGTSVLNTHITGPKGQTCSIMICHDHGDVGNVTLDHLLLDGYPQNTIYAGDTGGVGGKLLTAPGNIRITNSLVAKANGQNPGAFVGWPWGEDSRIFKANNTILETGAPIG